MRASSNVTRREFLETATVAGAGLVIGFHIPGGARFGPTPAAPFTPNAWLRINPDESVLVMVDRSEMGQGVTTSLPMLLAEELEADWSKIRIDFAPADKAYINPMFGMQGTGGSTSVRAAYTPLRKAGAAAREMLVAAAGETWGVDKSECRESRGPCCTRRAAGGSPTGNSPSRRPRCRCRTTCPSRIPRTGRSSGRGYGGSIRRPRWTAAPSSAST